MPEESEPAARRPRPDDKKPKRTKYAGQSRRDEVPKDATLPRRRMNARSIAIDALVRADTGSFANIDLPVRLRRSRLLLLLQSLHQPSRQRPLRRRLRLLQRHR